MGKLSLGIVTVVLVVAVLAASAGEEAPREVSWLQPWREATVALGIVGPVTVKLATGEEVERDMFIPGGTGVLFGLPDDAS